MPVQQLPLYPSEPHYSYQVELDGRIYGFEFHWNGRSAAWYLTVRTAAGEALVAGQRLVVGSTFFTSLVDFRLPPGELELVDTTGKQVDPTLDDLGRRVLLVYTPVADLPAGYVDFV